MMRSWNAPALNLKQRCASLALLHFQPTLTTRPPESRFDCLCMACPKQDISEFLWASASLNFVPDSGCLDMLQERALHRMSDFSAAVRVSRLASPLPPFPLLRLSQLQYESAGLLPFTGDFEDGMGSGLPHAHASAHAFILR
jgi:hypothetical protein